MLDPQAADLVDAIAQLCVARTEDYTLLQTVYKRAKAEHQQPAKWDGEGSDKKRTSSGPSSIPPGARVTANDVDEAKNHAYMQYLTQEVQVRERKRCEVESEWHEGLRRWAKLYLQREGTRLTGDGPSVGSHQVPSTTPQPPIWSFWEHEEDTFRRVYAAVVRQAYELEREDLINTPFAGIYGSKYLYSAAAAQEDTRNHSTPSRTNSAFPAPENVRRVHEIFFSGANPIPTVTTPVTPSQLVAHMHSIEPAESSSLAVTEAIRSRLAASRHVWLVLLFLWCHAAAAGVMAPGRGSHGNKGAEEGDREAFLHEMLCEPAHLFLDSQAHHLRSLQAKLQNWCI